MTVAQQCVKQKAGVLIRSQPAPDEIGFLSSIEATRIIRQDKKNMS